MVLRELIEKDQSHLQDEDFWQAEFKMDFKSLGFKEALVILCLYDMLGLSLL